ncbi:MAG: DUF2183 domain-containing protein [Myxococcales bacterium]|nr:DUF2183 domain-containing protein [Myxococcales bacterium]
MSHHAVRRPALVAGWLTLLALLVCGLGGQNALASTPRWAVLVYDGIGTEAGALVLGRVIEDRGLDVPKAGESTLRKANRLRRLLASHPLAKATVAISGAGKTAKLQTDERGFFKWRVPGGLEVGVHRVTARLTRGQQQRPVPGQLTVYPKAPGVLWVSDIDDTVLATDVRHKARMIKGLLTTNALELQSFPGVVDVLRAGKAAGHALAFVSGSPWQLQPRLRRFMAHRDLRRAPFFLKRIGLGDDADALMGQDGYKRRQLERLLKLLPGYKVICFGDSGEHDPEIYRALQKRHPGRVLGVLIHDVGGLKPKDPRVAGQVAFRKWPMALAWLERKGLLRTRKTAPTAGNQALASHRSCKPRVSVPLSQAASETKARAGAAARSVTSSP